MKKLLAATVIALVLAPATFAHSGPEASPACKRVHCHVSTNHGYTYDAVWPSTDGNWKVYVRCHVPVHGQKSCRLLRIVPT